MTRHKEAIDPASPIIAPFTILIDQREGCPYGFTGLHADADQHNRPIYVPTRFCTLTTGDYTISGLEDRVCVERKSLSDLYSTLGQGRSRFEREHERMAEIVAAGGLAVVVVESDWRTITLQPPENSHLLPKTVMRTWLSWRRKYGVEWIPAGDRRFAEITTFRMLQREWGRYCENNPSTGEESHCADTG